MYDNQTPCDYHSATGYCNQTPTHLYICGSRCDQHSPGALREQARTEANQIGIPPAKEG